MEEHGERRTPLFRVREGSDETLFLHCRNCDSLAVVAVAHFDPRHLAARGRADDRFCRLQLWFAGINILQNKLQFDPRNLKRLICSWFTFTSSCELEYRILNPSE